MLEQENGADDPDESGNKNKQHDGQRNGIIGKLQKIKKLKIIVDLIDFKCN